MPEQNREEEPFDFSLVMTDAETQRLKHLAFNLHGLGQKFGRAVEEIEHRKKRYEKNNLLKEKTLV